MSTVLCRWMHVWGEEGDSRNSAEARLVEEESVLSIEAWQNAVDALRPGRCLFSGETLLRACGISRDEFGLSKQYCMSRSDGNSLRQEARPLLPVEENIKAAWKERTWLGLSSFCAIGLPFWSLPHTACVVCFPALDTVISIFFFFQHWQSTNTHPFPPYSSRQVPFGWC
jgi:hypothetical protein